MALCLYELSKNKEIQRKVQQEIDVVVENYNSDEVDYELMSQLKYLENCVDETLRKYPPAPFLIRESNKDYRVPNSNQVITKGTSIIISSFGLHRDPDIYEDPLTFKPERFIDSTNGRGKATGLFYLPFGDGARVCVIYLLHLLCF